LLLYSSNLNLGVPNNLAISPPSSVLEGTEYQGIGPVALCLDLSSLEDSARSTRRQISPAPSIVLCALTRDRSSAPPQKREKKREREMSSSSGYVAIPRCPVFLMARITLISLPLCVFTCVVSICGVCSPARSPVRRAPLLLWLLFRRRRLLLVLMLLRLIRMLLRVLIGVLLLRMICSFISTPVPLRPIGWI
jgi:hypothetical protein